MNPTHSLLSKTPTDKRRELVDRVFVGACIMAGVVSIVLLSAVLLSVIVRGLGALSLDGLTQLPAPADNLDGGIAKAVVGTLELLLVASFIGIPLGLSAGIFLSEYPSSRAAKYVHFSTEVLSGIPSVTIGLFVFGMVVAPMQRFSVLAGSLALAILMTPTVTKTTRKFLTLVPSQLREASLGLGVSRWRTICFVVVRTALPGLITGIALAVARTAGEAAPLLITAFNNPNRALQPNEPVASLPVQIYKYALSPHGEWHRQAWAASLVLVTIILSLSTAARLLAKR